MQWFQKISKSEINQEGRMRSLDLSQTTINISKNDALFIKRMMISIGCMK